MKLPTITNDGAQAIHSTLQKIATCLPCAHLTVMSPKETLFTGAAGKFDILNESGDGRAASGEDVLWFASTSKLVTAIMYLQLVDQGLITLETDMRLISEPLAQASKLIFQGLDSKGQPQFRSCDKPITLLQMLNHTSGFGKEFGELTQNWKKFSLVGKGFVNSCKVENLINTPLMFEPGTSWEYGNSYEWLAFIFPKLTGSSFEDWLQSHVCKPVGMKRTTYYPFDNETLKGHLAPLRFSPNAEAVEETLKWERLEGQMEGLTLPRKREEIEYPVGGGGVYSCTTDYCLLLQHILTHYLSLSDPTISPPSNPLLSSSSVRSLFTPTLESREGMEGIMQNPAEAFSMVRGEKVGTGDINWSTGMSMFLPVNKGRRGGWGRYCGSVGWGGAAGTEYFMDPVAGIAYVFTTQMLPGRGRHLMQAKAEIEKCVYDHLV